MSTGKKIISRKIATEEKLGQLYACSSFIEKVHFPI